MKSLTSCPYRTQTHIGIETSPYNTVKFGLFGLVGGFSDNTNTYHEVIFSDSK